MMNLVDEVLAEALLEEGAASERVARQSDALFAAILAYKLRYDGNSPATRWLQEALGFASNATTYHHAGRLEAEGKIAWITASQNGIGRIAVVGAQWLPPPEGWDAKRLAELKRMPGRGARLACGLAWAKEAESTRTQVYAAILVHKVCCDGNAPAVRWLQKGLGISSDSVVSYHLRRLETEGKITRLSLEKYRTQIMVVGGRWLPPEGWDDGRLD